MTFFVASVLDEEKVKCFVEDTTDVSASGRSVGQVVGCCLEVHSDTSLCCGGRLGMLALEV